MGALSIWHILAVVVVAALLFGGRGKLSGLMGDAAQGIRAFRDGLRDPNSPAPPTTTEQAPPTPAPLPEPARENETAAR